MPTPDNVRVFATALARAPLTPLPNGRQLSQRLEDIFPGGHRMLQPTLVDPSTGLTLSAWLRLDNPDELAAALGDQPRPLQVATAQWERGDARSSRSAGHQASDIKAVFPLYEDKEPDPRFARDAALVLAAYRKWGPDCAVHFEGDFSFVILDPRDGSAYAARDAVGIRPLYIAVTDEVFAASPSSAVFDLIPGVDISVRWEWLADYIHDMSGDWRETPFVGVKRLPPGHWLRVAPDDVTERKYHEFSGDSPWEDIRDPRWLEAYRTELIRAVSVRTEPGGLIGVETSGGLDSSSILGVMAHTHPERISDVHTFGFAFFDLEPNFMLETSIAHGIESNHIFTNLLVRSVVQRRAWRSIGYPIEDGNSLAHMPIYSLASQLGVETLHSGHGGDEVVSNMGDLALQELIARRRLGQALRDLPGPRALRALRLAKRLRPRIAGESSLFEPMSARLQSTPLRVEVLEARKIHERTREVSQFAAPYGRVNDFVLGARLSPMTSIRTSDCSLVASSFGLEYRWALLDARLMQQYLHTPAIWKFGEGFGRYIHRRAVTGMVPESVAWKPDKSMGAQREATLRQRSVQVEMVRRESTAVDEEPAVPLQERLHGQLTELLDPARLRSVMGVSDEQAGSVPRLSKGRYLNNMLLLSDWLHDCP